MKNAIKTVCIYAWMLLLAAGMALVYTIFVFPNSFAPSGVSGIATMVQYIGGWKVSSLSLLINLPLLFVAFFLLERRFVLRTAAFTLAFSGALAVYANFDFSALAYHSQSGAGIVLAPLAAGVLNGAVYGAAMKQNACTGGTDVVAAIIRHFKPCLNLVWVIFALNACVAICSYFVYGHNFEPVIACILYCFISSRTCDSILKGGKAAAKFEIITARPQELTQALMHAMHHGVTLVPAKGMYSNCDKSLLICIINRHQIVDFERIIRSFPDTFAYVCSVNETVGNFINVKT